VEQRASTVSVVIQKALLTAGSTFTVADEPVMDTLLCQQQVQTYKQHTCAHAPPHDDQKGH
jgi:hypothetical protein